ncbi:MAG: amidoligase family protein [Cytophagaceae bacterium]
MEFKTVPVLYNDKGEVRKVGFELEFGELDLKEAASCIMNLYGGEYERYSNFLQQVKNTSIGDFILKMDTKVLTEKSYEKIFERAGISMENFGLQLEGIAERIASSLVPYEISIPPIPINEIEKADLLRKALFSKKAKGTGASIMNAYATHLNPELPSLDVDTILKYSRAFFLLYPYLFKIGEIDLARRVSTYINPFPKEYILKVLPPGYKPDLKTFSLDYHSYNSDRNRPLDLYPVLAYMDQELINSFHDIGNVKARPTFHYRLPNSNIDDENWSLATEWNRWVEIEKLACNDNLLEQLCLEYLALNQDVLIGFNVKWLNRIKEVIDV